MPHHAVTRADGRTLAVLEEGVPDGPVIVAHHGTPGAGLLYRPEVESARRRGLRLLTYDRPGYGGSTPDPGRRVADAADDVAAILDALGVERFATYGTSGGGPHALACAALLGDRCAAAATLAGVGEAGAPDLDWLAGMGEGNQVEFAAAKAGREPLTELLRAEAAGLAGATATDLADEMRRHLSAVDAAALTGELATHLMSSFTVGLAPGVEGWIDDDLAFVEPWGFDLGAIAAPVLVWQGSDDLMVPTAHGEWLREHVPGAEGGVLDGEGHLTLFAGRVADAHAWLLERLQPSSAR
jgi:pimeloyl-ACP methyl ester carboxylesterase